MRSRNVDKFMRISCQEVYISPLNAQNVCTYEQEFCKRARLQEARISAQIIVSLTIHAILEGGRYYWSRFIKSYFPAIPSVCSGCQWREFLNSDSFNYEGICIQLDSIELKFFVKITVTIDLKLFMNHYLAIFM